MTEGSLVMECCALAPGKSGARLFRCENPEQISAFAYGQQVLFKGKTSKKSPPLFSRGMALDLPDGKIVFVSGTASIKGEKTVYNGDVVKQTETTLENIGLVLSTAGVGLNDLQQLRVYVKDANDHKAVRGVVERLFPQVPSLYVHARVCRDDLMVEIEAVAVKDAAAKAVTEQAASQASSAERIFRPGKALLLALLLGLVPCANGFAATTNNLYQTSLPYIKLFQNNALTNGFPGFTRSYQGIVPAGRETAIGQYGASSYDLTILARIQQANNNNKILDTFVANWQAANNVVLNYNNGYKDANGNAINNLPYNIIRILGRDVPGWWDSWDWNVETGASAELINLSIEAYQRTGTASYLNFAKSLANTLLMLQDTDGGFRFGPVNVWHPTGNYFFWNLKSTEKNSRIFTAFESLYALTGDSKYGAAVTKNKTWLKGMYNKTEHLFHTVSQWDGTQWVKSPLGTTNEYFATDITAMVPRFIFTDTYFGATQAARDTEVRAMFAATEVRTAYTGLNGDVSLFKFSDGQGGDYGTVEWTAQMALAYLRAAQFYDGKDATQFRFYYDRFAALVFSLKNTFLLPASQDATSYVAPYASYLNGSVAGGVATGTGILSTEYYEASLASAWFAFALNGFDPELVNGGSGLPSAQPRITKIESVATNRDVRLTIQDPVGTAGYDVYYTSDLKSTNWTRAQTNVPTTKTGTTIWQDNGSRTGTHPSQAPKRFYKLKTTSSVQGTTPSSSNIPLAAFAGFAALAIPLTKPRGRRSRATAKTIPAGPVVIKHSVQDISERILRSWKKLKTHQKVFRWVGTGGIAGCALWFLGMHNSTELLRHVSQVWPMVAEALALSTITLVAGHYGKNTWSKFLMAAAGAISVFFFFRWIDGGLSAIGQNIYRVLQVDGIYFIRNFLAVLTAFFIKRTFFQKQDKTPREMLSYAARWAAASAMILGYFVNFDYIPGIQEYFTGAVERTTVSLGILEWLTCVPLGIFVGAVFAEKNDFVTNLREKVKQVIWFMPFTFLYWFGFSMMGWSLGLTGLGAILYFNSIGFVWVTVVQDFVERNFKKELSEGKNVNEHAVFSGELRSFLSGLEEDDRKTAAVLFTYADMLQILEEYLQFAGKRGPPYVAAYYLEEENRIIYNLTDQEIRAILQSAYSFEQITDLIAFIKRHERAHRQIHCSLRFKDDPSQDEEARIFKWQFKDVKRRQDPAFSPYEDFSDFYDIFNRREMMSIEEFLGLLASRLATEYPDDFRVRSGLVKSFITKKMYAEAEGLALWSLKDAIRARNVGPLSEVDSVKLLLIQLLAIYRASENDEKRKNVLEKMAVVYPQDVRILTELAVVCETLSEKRNKVELLTRSRDALKKAIEIDPGDVRSWVSLGRILFKVREYHDALVAAGKVVELDPCDSRGYVQQAHALRKLFLYEEALSALELGEQRCPREMHRWLAKEKRRVLSNMRRENGTDILPGGPGAAMADGPEFKTKLADLFREGSAEALREEAETLKTRHEKVRDLHQRVLRLALARWSGENVNRALGAIKRVLRSSDIERADEIASWIERGNEGAAAAILASVSEKIAGERKELLDEEMSERTGDVRIWEEKDGRVHVPFGAAPRARTLYRWQRILRRTGITMAEEERALESIADRLKELIEQVSGGADAASVVGVIAAFIDRLHGARAEPKRDLKRVLESALEFARLDKKEWLLETLRAALPFLAVRQHALKRMSYWVERDSAALDRLRSERLNRLRAAISLSSGDHFMAWPFLSEPDLAGLRNIIRRGDKALALGVIDEALFEGQFVAAYRVRVIREARNGILCLSGEERFFKALFEQWIAKSGMIRGAPSYWYARLYKAIFISERSPCFSACDTALFIIKVDHFGKLIHTLKKNDRRAALDLIVTFLKRVPRIISAKKIPVVERATARRDIVAAVIKDLDLEKKVPADELDLLYRAFQLPSVVATRMSDDQSSRAGLVSMKLLFAVAGLLTVVLLSAFLPAAVYGAVWMGTLTVLLGICLSRLTKAKIAWVFQGYRQVMKAWPVWLGLAGAVSVMFMVLPVWTWWQQYLAFMATTSMCSGLLVAGAVSSLCAVVGSFAAELIKRFHDPKYRISCKSILFDTPAPLFLHGMGLKLYFGMLAPLLLSGVASGSFWLGLLYFQVFYVVLYEFFMVGSIITLSQMSFGDMRRMRFKEPWRNAQKILQGTGSLQGGFETFYLRDILFWVPFINIPFIVLFPLCAPGLWPGRSLIDSSSIQSLFILVAGAVYSMILALFARASREEAGTVGSDDAQSKRLPGMRSLPCCPASVAAETVPAAEDLMDQKNILIGLERMRRMFTAYEDMLTEYGRATAKEVREVVTQITEGVPTAVLRRAQHLIGLMPDPLRLDLKKDGEKNWMKWFSLPDVGADADVIGRGCRQACLHCIRGNVDGKEERDTLPVVIEKGRKLSTDGLITILLIGAIRSLASG